MNYDDRVSFDEKLKFLKEAHDASHQWKLKLSGGCYYYPYYSCGHHIGVVRQEVKNGVVVSLKHIPHNDIYACSSLHTSLSNQ